MAETGSVKFYNAQKAYGFIARAGADDVFVHRTDLRATGLDSLEQGQRVTFDVVPGRDGRPKAANVLIGSR